MVSRNAVRFRRLRALCNGPFLRVSAFFSMGLWQVSAWHSARTNSRRARSTETRTLDMRIAWTLAIALLLLSLAVLLPLLPSLLAGRRLSSLS